MERKFTFETKVKDLKEASDWLRELADRIDSMECNRLQLTNAGGRVGVNGKWKLEE